MALVRSSEIEAAAGAVKRRRRSYTAAEKARLVRATQQPGASVSLLARQHGINANLLFTWRRRARRGDVAAATPVMAPAFVPVGVVGGGRIELELPNGVRLQVEGAVDRHRLVEVLAAVKAAW